MTSTPSAEPLALFDFDGTLTTCDSLWVYLRTALPRPVLLWGMTRFLPHMAGAACGLSSRDRAKERLLAYFFEGWSQERMVQIGEQVAHLLIAEKLRPGALETLREYRRKGFRTVLVSASTDVWIEPCARLLGMEALCTRLDFRDGLFTGRFASPNCIGEEKVRRIKEAFPDWEQRTLHAYGDSKGDTAMLALAEQSVYRPFRAD